MKDFAEIILIARILIAAVVVVVAWQSLQWSVGLGLRFTVEDAILVALAAVVVLLALPRVGDVLAQEGRKDEGGAQ